jgi:citrate lyase gamma subunit
MLVAHQSALIVLSKHSIMLRLKQTMLLAVLAIALNAGAQTKEIYTHPKFDSIAHNHTLLAILPFDVLINLRPKEKEKLKPGELEQIQKKEGEAVQSAVQTYFLRKKEKENFKVNFQDISKTNTLLLKNGWTTDSLRAKTKEEICALLGVDGLISGTLNTDKPMSDGASVALGVAFGFWGPTNSGKCTINVHEANEGELLWKYEKTLSRSLGSDINTIINTMMRKASKKFPYEDIR